MYFSVVVMSLYHFTDSETLTVIRTAFNTWEQHTCLSFEEVSASEITAPGILVHDPGRG